MKSQRKPTIDRLSSHLRHRFAPMRKAVFDELGAVLRDLRLAVLASSRKNCLVRMAALGGCLIRLFLTARHERLDVQPFLEDGKYRPGDDYAERTLKTCYGEVTYGRHYLHGA